MRICFVATVLQVEVWLLDEREFGNYKMPGGFEAAKRILVVQGWLLLFPQ